MSRTAATIAAVALFAAAVIGWPVIAEGRSFFLSAVAIVVMWIWLLAVMGIGTVPYPYHRPVAAIAIVLSFVSPLLSFLAIGTPFAQFVASWLAIALGFTVLCIVIFRKA